MLGASSASLPTVNVTLYMPGCNSCTTYGISSQLVALERVFKVFLPFSNESGETLSMLYSKAFDMSMALLVCPSIWA